MKSESGLVTNEGARKLLTTGIGIALAAGGVPAAQASTYTVTSLLDDGSAGTLRDAINQADVDPLPPATVQFQAGLSGTIMLNGTQIAITALNGPVTVQGPGAANITIDANHASRVFYVAPETVTDVTISGLTLTNGNVSSDGGAIRSLGANFTLQDSVIENSSTTNSGGGVFAGIGGAANVAIMLANVTLSGNTARDGGGARLEPGTGGTGVVENCVISGNTATTGWGGGLYLKRGATSVIASQVVDNHALANEAGGIEAYFTNFTITDSKVSGNTAGTGNAGGLYVSHSSLQMARTFVGGNTANNGGGGMALNKNFYNGALGATIQDSTFSNNIAAGSRGGGGILALYNSKTNITLTNVTIYGNSSGGWGGGLYSETGYAVGANYSGVLTIESSTIIGNSGAVGGGIANSSKANAMVVHNTIVANDTASIADNDVHGSFTANFDLILDPGAATLNGGTGNITGVDPQLGPLAVNGGPTQTMLPAIGSPVIDAGDNTGAPSTDQRGLPRPVNGVTDIGAVERQNPEDVIFRDGFGP